MSSEDIKMVLEIINTIAIIIASIVAICGISAWRKEFQGKRNIELAEDVLCLYYQAERAIKAIRIPISYSTEEEGREQQDRETTAQRRARDQAHVVFKRIREHGQIFDELYKLRFNFMARFGRETAEPFDKLKGIIDEIWISGQQLAILWAHRYAGCKVSEATENQIEHHENIIWSLKKDDPLADRLKQVINDIESICKPIILGKNK